MDQFNEFEVLQLAQNLEDRGFQFYSQAATFFAEKKFMGQGQASAGDEADAVARRETAALARRLAEAEREHREVFQRLAQEVAVGVETRTGAGAEASPGTGDGAREDLYLYDPEVSAYFRLLVATAVFPSPEEIPAVLAALKSPADLLRLAIQTEKDALLFFQAFGEKAPGEKTRRVLARVLAEEKAHLRALQEALGGTRIFSEALLRFQGRR